MTHPKDVDDTRPNLIALAGALIGMGFMTLSGIGLAASGLWLIGVPMALIFGAWFIYTLIKRPRWRFGGSAPRRPRRIRGG